MTLAPLSHSLLLLSVALAAAVNACSHPPVRALVAPDFASGALQIRRLAIMPMDLVLHWDGQQVRQSAMEELGQRSVARAMAGLTHALQERGYRVSSVISPDGTATTPGQEKSLATLVIHPADLASLRVEVHQGTRAGIAGRDPLQARIAIDLTQQIATSTGAEATVYARGWAFLHEGESGAATAGKVIVGVLLALLVVGLIIWMVSGGRGDKVKGTPGPKMGRAARTMARASFAAGQVAMHAAPHIAVAVAAHQHHQAHVPCHRCDLPPPAMAAAPSPPGPGIDAQLALGPAVPPRTSTAALEITIVHNSSGRVVWHASERYEMEADDEEDIQELVEHFVQALPPAPTSQAPATAR